MAMPYDATLKPLVEMEPNAFVAFLRTVMDLPDGPATTVDSEHAMAAPRSDKQLLVGDEALLDVGFQASSDPQTLPRMLAYNAVGAWRRRLPCISVLFLLRPEADGPEHSGEFAWAVRGRRQTWLRCQTVRVWQLPLRLLLDDPRWATLAPITDAAKADLPGTIRQAAARIEAAGGSNRVELLASMRILMGLRYEQELIDRLFEGVRAMRESTVYQGILAEGQALGEARGEARSEARWRAEEARRLLRRAGVRRLGPPSPTHERQLAELADHERLEELFDRVHDAASWDELLGGTPTGTNDAEPK